MNKYSSYFLLSCKNIYRLAFYLSLLMLGLLLLLRIAIINSYVSEITGVDNNFVNTVVRMLGGLSPYPDPQVFPYYGNIYSPLYFTVCYFIGKLIHVQPQAPIQVYRLCRMVALACDVVSVYLLYKILIKNVSLAKPIALLVTAFFSSILCYLAYTFSRVDCLFLTLYISVFYFLLNKSFQKDFIYSGLLGFLCTACVYTKQNGSILPLLVAVWFFFSNQRKKILPFLFSFFIFFSLFYLIFTKWAGYTYLTTYTIKGLNNKIDFQWFYTYIFKLLANSVLLLPLSVGMVIAVGFMLFTKEPDRKALGAVYIIQLVFSTGAALKWGSSLGYYNESFFLAMILVARFSGMEKLPKRIQQNLFWLSIPIVLIFFLHTFFQDYLFFVNQQQAKKEKYMQQLMVRNYLIQHLNGKHVLDLNVPNQDFFKNLLYREIAVPQFDTVDCCLLPDGTFDYSALKAELQSGEIKFIIFPKDQPEVSIWGVPLTHYKKDTTIFNYDIYKYTPVVQ